jgi:hypothetical protein
MSNNNQEQEKKAKHVSVVCKTGAFRRAGYSFGKQPVLIEINKENEAALRLIKKESMLTVSAV